MQGGLSWPGRATWAGLSVGEPCVPGEPGTEVCAGAGVGSGCSRRLAGGGEIAEAGVIPLGWPWPIRSDVANSRSVSV